MADAFQYRTETEYGALMSSDRMNRLGEDGWELVSVVSGNTNFYHHIFKRKVIKDPKIKQIN